MKPDFSIYMNKYLVFTHILGILSSYRTWNPIYLNFPLYKKNFPQIKIWLELGSDLQFRHDLNLIIGFMAPELNNIFGIIFEKVSSDYPKTFLLNAP